MIPNNSNTIWFPTRTAQLPLKNYIEINTSWISNSKSYVNYENHAKNFYFSDILDIQDEKKESSKIVETEE